MAERREDSPHISGGNPGKQEEISKGFLVSMAHYQIQETVTGSPE